MKAPPGFSVRRANWIVDGAQLRALRKRVFVEEQGVPETLEWDGLDAACIHVLATLTNGLAIGTGRLLPDGHIGRMAVLAQWRRRGVGSAVLEALMAAAQARGDRIVELSAQTHALGFYARLGFETVSGEYMDAGIAHRTMRYAFRRMPR